MPSRDSTTDDTEDFDVVVMNPAAFYNGPADVMADGQLTRDQKLRLLEEWEIDLKRTLESDSEGMAQGAGPNLHPDDEGRRANDAALLRQVSNWLRRARGDDALGEDLTDAPKTVMGRVWHRLFNKTAPREAA
ncbi:MAG: hypothetical protein IT548_08990 [Alphaproteobacteria bacterium]|nr:hypothetical protein [Alphaproteobacteria bacterium]